MSNTKTGLAKRLATVALAALLAVLPTMGQEQSAQRQIYAQAESDYQLGRLEKAVGLLQAHVETFSGALRQSAFRLLTLCLLAQDREDEARLYADKLLKEDPYYSPTAQDPPRLSDIVAAIKANRVATITTASSQEESIAEVPVPVSLITEEMIELSGARNLQELLAAYVPGMTIVDSNDDMTTAMRGIFGTSQEKMLVLLNGHRLNSYATNNCNLDYSISLDKIKQVEVLRGPSSSLYGGVALTGVVNIITKNGYDVDGVVLHAGAGNYGQLRADLLFGKFYNDLNLLVWASLYQADGQKTYMDVGETSIGRYGGHYLVGAVRGGPSYDIGVNVNWRHCTLLYTSRCSKVVTPLTAGYTFLPYDYYRYASIRGQEIGKGIKAHHAELSYNNRFGLFNVGASVSYDNDDQMHYQALTDSSMAHLGALIGLPTSNSLDSLLSVFKGIFRYHDAQERHIGGMVKASYDYANTDRHKGTLSLGAHFRRFSLGATRYFVGGNFETPLLEPEIFAQMGPGSEDSGDAYMQWKHRWGRWLLNAGLRYDFITHYNGQHINELSPRATLIYLAPKWNIKLNYSRSFVDAPYFYRKTNELLSISSMGGIENIPLMSEKLDSWQVDFGSSKLVPGLAFDVNLFYNSASNLIYAEGLVHVNAGVSKIIGAEFSAQYNRKRLDLNLAAAWLHSLESDVLSRLKDKQYNVPEFSANLVAGYKLTDRLKVHGRLCCYGPQDSYQVKFVSLGEGQGASGLDYRFLPVEVPARAIVDIGASYQLSPVTFRVNIHNLLNTTYYQGGLAAGNVRQQGMWFALDASVKL